MPSSPATRNEPPIGAATASRAPTPREFFDLGLAFNALKQHQKALESFDLAIQLQPDFFEAHSNRGAMLAALGRHEDAIESYRKALTIRPDFADAHCNLASALTQLRRYDEALASLDRALALRADYPDALDPERGAARGAAVAASARRPPAAAFRGPSR